MEGESKKHTARPRVHSFLHTCQADIYAWLIFIRLVSYLSPLYACQERFQAPRNSRTQWCQRTGPQIMVFTLIFLPRRTVWMTVTLTCMVLPMTAQRSRLPFTTQHTEPTCLLSRLIKVRRHILHTTFTWTMWDCLSSNTDEAKNALLSIRMLDGLMG